MERKDILTLSYTDVLYLISGLHVANENMEEYLKTYPIESIENRDKVAKLSESLVRRKRLVEELQTFSHLAASSQEIKLIIVDQ